MLHLPVPVVKCVEITAVSTLKHCILYKLLDLNTEVLVKGSSTVNHVSLCLTLTLSPITVVQSYGVEHVLSYKGRNTIKVCE